MLHFIITLKKIREEISIDTRFDDKAKFVLNKYLDYLVQYYKKIIKNKSYAQLATMKK